jgi:TRAP-type C4-dicarboxylate transport system substrate-binding protein
MLDLPIAPAMAAIVINRVTWNKLGSDRQRDLMRVTQRVAADFDTAMPRTISGAVTAMQRDGLKVHKPNQAQEGLWHAEASKVMPMLLGTTFDRDIYQRINVILDRARGGR